MAFGRNKLAGDHSAPAPASTLLTAAFGRNKLAGVNVCGGLKNDTSSTDPVVMGASLGSW